MFDTTVDDKAIYNRDDMCDSISGIQNCSSVADIGVDSWWGDESEDGLDADVKTFDVECFEHDFSDVLSVFWWVEGRFCEHDDCLLWVTAEVVEEASVPEFLHEVPVFDYSSLNRVDYFMTAVEVSGLLSDDEVKGLAGFSVAACPAGLVLGAGLCNQGGYVEGGLWVSGVAHFGVAGSVVYDYNFFVEVHIAILCMSFVCMIWDCDYDYELYIGI